MKNTYLAKQDNSHATAFSFTDLCTQFLKQTFNVTPLNVGTCWSGEDEIQRALVFSLHRQMVLLFGTFSSMQGVCLVPDVFQRGTQTQLPHPYPNNAIIPASSSTATPSACALSSLLPASAPATT